MNVIATRRCPSCGLLQAIDQSTCRNCLAPLPAVVSPGQAAIGETCRLYRSAAGSALLLSSSLLEYSAPGIVLSTPWSNISSITDGHEGALLWLYQTPPDIKLALGSSREWFSDRTRTVPLRQFGFPANADLAADLCRYAPQLRRYIASGEQ